MITQQTAGAETQLRRPLSWVWAVACAAELRRWANIESEARDMKIGNQLFFAPDFRSTRSTCTALPCPNSCSAELLGTTLSRLKSAATKTMRLRQASCS